MSEEAARTVGKRTGVEIGLMIVIMVAVVGGTAWTTNTTRDISVVKQAINDLTNQIADSAGDRWRGNDMIWFAKRLNELNPDIVVPDIERRLEIR